MGRDLVLAIDQGTTSSKALLVDASGRVVASAARPLSIHSPRPGWVEQDASELWASVADAVGEVLLDHTGSELLGVAISNQRETVVAWDSDSGEPLGPAISWQDQRGDALCRRLATGPNSELVRTRSGLELGSMFSASKVAWFLEQHPGRAGTRIGTVDSWLVDRLTAGEVYATEAGNASRTLLYDIAGQSWSQALGDLFGVDTARLAPVLPSVGPWGVARGVPGLPDGTPILAVLGDSHAALYGHRALAPDRMAVGKATYGTGSSVMMPVDAPSVRVGGISTTLAWQAPETLWALEGNILYSGAGLDWLARLLGLSPGAEFSAVAETAAGSRGVVFVPALNGLGAPWWASSAVGTLTGLTGSTTPAEVAFAGIEAVAHQICDVVDAMDPQRLQPAIHAGGGAARSKLLMQTQADLLGRTVLRSSIPDVSALGAAALGFRVAGVPFEPASELAPHEVRPSPAVTEDERAARRLAWREALVGAGVAA